MKNKILFKNLKNLIKIKKKLISNYNLGIYKYHKLFRLPLIGTMWEQVLEEILTKSGIDIEIPVSSSHQRGKDLKVKYFGWISCKTTKQVYKVKKQLWACSISSYRLGSSTNYLETIANLDKTFNFYFLSIYYEDNGYYIYSLYIIPSKYLIDLTSFTFRGEKSNIYNNVQLHVKKSMSHQLWINILDMKEFEKFKVTAVKIKILLATSLLD